MATEYVVLLVDKEGKLEQIGKAEGGNELAAIRALLAASDGKYGAGKYRGVPARSWADEPHDLKPKVSFV